MGGWSLRKSAIPVLMVMIKVAAMEASWTVEGFLSVLLRTMKKLRSNSMVASQNPSDVVIRVVSFLQFFQGQNKPMTLQQIIKGMNKGHPKTIIIIVHLKPQPRKTLGAPMAPGRKIKASTR